MTTTFAYSLLIFSLLISFISCQFMSEEQMTSYKRFLANQDRLFGKLFQNYDSGISAVYTLHHITDNSTVHPPRFEIDIALSMLKLVEVVEPEEKVTFLFDYQSNWYDPRLTWNPEDYGGINHIYVPRNRIWIPETTIVDCSEIKNFEDELTRYAWLHYNGSIGTYTASVTSVVCSMNVYNFPMDQHTCSVNILFHTYLMTEFVVNGHTGTLPRPVKQLGNGEWQMQSIQMTIEPVVDNMTYLTKFEATFSRNPGFYIALVMIPAYFINVLSIVALFINIEDRAEKFTVGLTNIMSMSFILVILSADLPKTKDLPLLAVYTITSLAIMLCSISAVVALPKLKEFYAKKRLERGEKVLKPNDEVPRNCWGKFKYYFRIEYVFMAVFQIANFINFIIIFF